MSERPDATPLILGEHIEKRPKRTGRPAVSIAGEGVADHFRSGTVLGPCLRINA